MEKNKSLLASIDREHLEEVVLDLFNNLFKLHRLAKDTKNELKKNGDEYAPEDTERFLRDVIGKFYYDSLAGLDKSFEKVGPCILSFGKEYKDLDLSTKKMIGWYRNRSKEAIEISKKLHFK